MSDLAVVVATIDASRPTVMVTERLPFGLYLDVDCTECGHVDELDLPLHAGRKGRARRARVRHRACLVAWRHAEDTHDGDVFREGWT